MFPATGDVQSVKVSATGNVGPLVAAVTGMKIRVVGLMLVAGGAGGTITFKSATTALSGAMPLGANGVLTMPATGPGLCDTAKGEALNLDVSGAVYGVVLYQVIR